MLENALLSGNFSVKNHRKLFQNSSFGNSLHKFNRKARAAGLLGARRPFRHSCFSFIYRYNPCNAAKKGPQDAFQEITGHFLY
jgi:hypothetical protein